MNVELFNEVRDMMAIFERFHTFFSHFHNENEKTAQENVSLVR